MTKLRVAWSRITYKRHQRFSLGISIHPRTIEGVPRIRAKVRDGVTEKYLDSYPYTTNAIVSDLPVRQFACIVCTLYHSTQQKIHR